VRTISIPFEAAISDLFKGKYMKTPARQFRWQPVASQWVSEHRRLEIMRALPPALVLALCITAGSAWLLQPNQAGVRRPEYQSLSMERTPAQFYQAFKTIHALARSQYIKRDLAGERIESLADQFDARLYNDGDFIGAINLLFGGMGDPWTELVTRQEWEDTRLREQGSRIGTEVGFNYDSDHKSWKTVNVKGDNAATGLEDGDFVLDIDGNSVTEIEETDATGLKKITNMINTGSEALYGNTFAIHVIKKSGQEATYDLRRGVLGVDAPITTKGASNIRDGNKTDESVQQIDVNFFAAPNTSAEIGKVLALKRDKPLRGVVLVLEGAHGGTGMEAALTAAMFIEKGVICHKISNVEQRPGAFWMDSWEVQPGLVRLVRRGPFTPEPGRKGRPKAAAPDQELKRIETLTGIFTGSVAICIDMETRGAPELVASAIRENNPNAVIFGSTTTSGKGLAQTYFVNYAEPEVFGFSTGFYLSAIGEQIDRVSISPSDDGKINGDQLVPLATKWVFDRLRKVPVPILPER
jgi:C-terminal processing protease CtpA/Prc